MSEPLYRQCQLRQGRTLQIVWLPVQFAKAGKSVRVNGEYKDWLIVQAWPITKPEHLLTFNERSHRAEFGSLA